MSILADYYFNPYAIPTSITAIFVLIMGTTVFLQNARSDVNFFFALACLSIFIWLSGYSIIYLSRESAVALSWYKYYAQIGLFAILPNIYSFVRTLKKPLKSQKRLLISVYLITAIFCLLGLSNGFVTGMTKYFWGWYPLFGPLSYPFMAFFLLLMTLAFCDLWLSQGKMGSKIENKRIKIVFIATMCGYIAALDFLPVFKIGLYPFGYINIFVWISFMSYAVLRYRLMRLTSAVAAEQIISIIPDFLILIDKKGKIIVVNRAIEEALGYKKEELINKPIETVIPQPDTAKILFSDLEKKETVTNLEAIYKSKDGNEIPVSFSRSVLRDDVGDIAGFVITALDITERKKAREELKDSEERLRILFEYAPDAYYLNDLKGVFVDGNKATEELVGYGRDELIEKTFLQLNILPPSQMLKLSTLLSVSALGQPTGPDEFLLVRKDGQHLMVEIRTFPVRIKGKVLILGIAHDITRRKKMEEALLENERKIRALFDQTFQFIGLMTIDGILMDANQAALELSGVEASSVLNKPFWEGPWWAHSPELREKLRQAVKKAANGEFIRFEATHNAKDGILHYVDFSLKPVTDETGKVIFLIPEGRDITDLKQLEEAERKHMQELEVFYKASIGREERIIELKKEVERLKK